MENVDIVDMYCYCEQQHLSVVAMVADELFQEEYKLGNDFQNIYHPYKDRGVEK